MAERAETKEEAVAKRPWLTKGSKLDQLRKRSQDAEEHFNIAAGSTADLIDAHVDYISELEKENFRLRHIEDSLVWLSSDKRQLYAQVRDLRKQNEDLQRKNSNLNRSLGKVRDALREALGGV